MIRKKCRRQKNSTSFSKVCAILAYTPPTDNGSARARPAMTSIRKSGHAVAAIGGAAAGVEGHFISRAPAAICTMRRLGEARARPGLFKRVVEMRATRARVGLLHDSSRILQTPLHSSFAAHCNGAKMLLDGQTMTAIIFDTSSAFIDMLNGADGE